MGEEVEDNPNGAVTLSDDCLHDILFGIAFRI